MPPTPRTITEYDREAPTPDATETATFGLGCFWGPDAQFAALDGVVRTRVGYAGGETPEPSYHALGDHTEVVQLDYDPERIAYADLLEAAFRSLARSSQPKKRQYHYLVCPATDTQRQAVDTALDANGLTEDEVGTRIETLSAFYPAESYHQKYSLRTDRTLLNCFEEAGYDDQEIRESPAAAKLNAERAGRDIDPIPELGIGVDPRVRRN